MFRKRVVEQAARAYQLEQREKRRREKSAVAWFLAKRAAEAAEEWGGVEGETRYEDADEGVGGSSAAEVMSTCGAVRSRWSDGGRRAVGDNRPSIELASVVIMTS